MHSVIRNTKTATVPLLWMSSNSIPVSIHRSSTPVQVNLALVQSLPATLANNSPQLAMKLKAIPLRTLFQPLMLTLTAMRSSMPVIAVLSTMTLTSTTASTTPPTTPALVNNTSVT
jgi:hypothetical protein